MPVADPGCLAGMLAGQADVLLHPAAIGRGVPLAQAS